ncbi:MAG: potassium/proton antiporter [Solirubrobacterales bacterium]
MTDGELILAGGALLGAGLAASLLASSFRVPALVLVLGGGMLIGSDGTGWIEFSDYELARTIGVIALSLILFEGGLASGWGEIGPVWRPAVLLAFFGTIGTAILTGLTAAWLFDFSTLEGLLLGSVLAATDAAAVFSVLRASTLRRHLARTLEGESGMNDPVAVLLVLGFIEWILHPDFGFGEMVVLFGEQLAIGLAAGLAIGFLGVELLKRSRLASGGLYPVATLAIAAVAFGGSEVLGGSGFLAVYLAGLVLGSRPIPARRTIAAFHEGLSWVAQVAMFFTLGLLVFPGDLDNVALEGIILAIVAVVIARPLATFAATAFERYTAAERLILGWAGMRGAVPVVLATFPVIDGVTHSQEFFNIAFFVVLLSTVVQGATIEPLARRLRMTTSSPALPRPLGESATVQGLGAEIVEYPVAKGDAIVSMHVRDLALPREALVNVIVRGGRAIPPRGSTRVSAGDVLHIMVTRAVASELYPLLERWRKGPMRAEPAREEEVWMTMPVYRARPPDDDG